MSSLCSDAGWRRGGASPCPSALLIYSWKGRWLLGYQMRHAASRGPEGDVRSHCSHAISRFPARAFSPCRISSTVSLSPPQSVCWAGGTGQATTGVSKADCTKLRWSFGSWLAAWGEFRAGVWQQYARGSHVGGDKSFARTLAPLQHLRARVDSQRLGGERQGGRRSVWPLCSAHQLHAPGAPFHVAAAYGRFLGAAVEGSGFRVRGPSGGGGAPMYSYSSEHRSSGMKK
ncbi:hypothetical protein T484DRAFT_2389933 [Baffinella frigidus]|nr:hypothetical protein T484DRAFT_2389933 [Cryptophyta sp. CCMP2293]